MLQITIQHKEELQITDEFKIKVAESISHYVLNNWDKIITTENIDNNYVISIEM